MTSNRLHGYLLVGAALVAMLPTAALADTAKEKELEARLSALEQAFGSLQGELQNTRAENAELLEAVTRAETRTTEVAAVAQAAQAAANKPVSAAADGFSVGNGATRVKIGGLLKTVATFSRWSDGDAAPNSLGRDFYLPQTIPVGGLRESTDFVGPTEGTVFVRQPLIRYSIPAGKGLTLHVSAENPETASANQGAPPLIENDDDSMPDFAARLAYSDSFGEVSPAGLVRQLAVDNGVIHDEVMGYGASLAGNLFWSPAPGLDLGVEYRHGERELVSRSDGKLDRFEFAAEYSF